MSRMGRPQGGRLKRLRSLHADEWIPIDRGQDPSVGDLFEGVPNRYAGYDPCHTESRRR